MSAPPARTGQLWVIAAPSGAGKTSLVRALLERDPRLRFSISYTTRARRSSEVDGATTSSSASRSFTRWCATTRSSSTRGCSTTGTARGASTSPGLLDRRLFGGARDRLAGRAPGPRARAGLAERVHPAAERRRARTAPARAQDRLRGRHSAPAEGCARRHDALDASSITSSSTTISPPRSTGWPPSIGGREQGARTDSPAVRAAAEAIVERPTLTPGPCPGQGVLH